MDIYFLYLGQRFVWDSEKASVNAIKHGVGFELACQVFFDPFVHLVDASADDEQREAVIGLTENWSVLFVVHGAARGRRNPHYLGEAVDGARKEIL